MNNSYIKYISKVKFIPEYDILRALAILLVVANHYFGNKINSGFIGVDIFFTLSGCVIAKSLFSKIAIDKKFSYLDFYKKRIMRIFPNICLYILIVFICLILSGDIASLKYVSNEAIRAILFVSNFSIKESNDYFGNIDSSFFEIFWSLSIEEQFYFIFPLILIFIYILAKKFTLNNLHSNNKEKFKINFLTGNFLSFFVFSLISLSLAFSSISNNDFHYASSLSRFWQISVGSLISIFLFEYLPLCKKRFIRFFEYIFKYKINLLVLCASIVILIILSISDIDKLSYPNNKSLIVTFFTSLCLLFSPGALNKNQLRILSPLMFIAKVSYGWYLWHWLVLEISKYYSLSISSPINRLILLFVSFFLTVIIYYFYELPIRKNINPLTNIYILISYFGFLPLSFFLPNIALRLPIFNENLIYLSENFDTGISSKKFLEENNYTSILNMECDTYFMKNNGKEIKNMFNQFKENCFNLRENKLNILLIGDSHAQQYIPALDSKETNILPLIGSGCNFTAITKNNKNLSECNVLSQILEEESILKKINYVVVGNDRYENLPLLMRFLDEISLINKKISFLVIGNTPHWENYLPKIAIRNLRGEVENKYTSISLNKQSINDDIKQKNFFRSLKRNNVEYLSITDLLCINGNDYSCLVGFKDKKDKLNLTSYDKSHLTFQTTNLLKSQILERLKN